jgi:hypothetical protein
MKSDNVATIVDPSILFIHLIMNYNILWGHNLLTEHWDSNILIVVNLDYKL